MNHDVTNQTPPIAGTNAWRSDPLGHPVDRGVGPHRSVARVPAAAWDTEGVLFVDLAVTSRNVAATSKRGEKIVALAQLLTGLAPDEIESAAAFLVGATRHGRIGVGWSTLHDVRPAPAGEERWY